MIIDYPSGDTGFVEYKRAFCVMGTFSAEKIPQDSFLCVTLFNSSGECVRSVMRQGKYGDCDAYYPGLTAYAEERDPGRIKMQEFGFPELSVEDGESPEKSLRNAEKKAWFSDREFKAVVVSATDMDHGALADDGMSYVSGEGKPYELLPMGEYVLKIELTHNGETLDAAEKKLIIGRRENQLICRFNPEEHKKRMVEWCRTMGFSVISDPLPGYLDSYLGDWEYHKGLLKMYRANDIPLFETAKVRMFVYLIDPESTSYETELAYLQTKGAVGDSNRFFAYHYDIGEAVVGKGRPYGRKGVPVQFGEDEFLSVLRIDIVNKKAKEGVYFLDERAVERSLFGPSLFSIKKGERFAVTGVMKPWQMNPEDFVLREDNTYKINNYPNIMHYTVSDGEKETVFQRKAGTERKDKKSIGNSVYEFYNIFTSDNWEIGKTLRFSVVCIDKLGNKTPAKAEFLVKVV